MLGGTAGRYGPQITIPIRLNAVAGFQNRENDVVYCPPLEKHEDESTAVVYFGGDVQDFTENMEVNRDSRSYMKYNLESTALLLRQGYPKSHVIVVRPARMEFKTFSCFDNFVRCNNAGVPDHTPTHHSLDHIEKLLETISQRLTNFTQVAATATVLTPTNIVDPSQDMDIDILQDPETVTVDTDAAIVLPCKDDAVNSISVLSSDLTPDLLQAVSAPSTSEVSNLTQDPFWWLEKPNLDKCKLTLIGFSKGCVVLNQFIYEFHYLKTLTPDERSKIHLLSRIKEMYWLDGGHGGPKNTWITSRSLLETLNRLNINIHVHVTPYQVQDERRPWIRKEEKTFSDLLRRLGAPLTRCLHFENSSPNLFTHFEVLQVFRQPCPPQLPPIHVSPPKDGEEK